MFHWCFNVSRGSDTFRAIDLRATILVLNVTLEVLMPNIFPIDHGLSYQERAYG